ncbi:hypothetical protein D9615_006112 [Tricholomella constricta]|uniref:Carbonic anhydrase n=1 Tax=Tricholomella constricta TaxID=117010 RepID=A0A8H5M411_9AGAR|nr:hypothetical protein D9615_006112 [Tricholomella constricta]
MHLAASLIFAALFTCLPVSSICVQDGALHTRDHAGFTYTGETGPLGWTKPKHNKLCSTGKHQSPINLVAANAMSTKESLTIDISDVDSGELENTGHSLQVKAKGTVKLGEQEYALSQFHFHTPSEHRVDDEYYPLEMHMVFTRDSGKKLLVLGTLFEVTKDSSIDLIATLAKSAKELTDTKKTATTEKLVFSGIKAHFDSASNTLYKYEGSLTTPPCTEGVTWIIVKQTLSVNVDDFLTFKNVMKFNSRYTQNTLGRNNLITVAKNNYPKA